MKFLNFPVVKSNTISSGKLKCIFYSDDMKTPILFIDFKKEIKVHDWVSEFLIENILADRFTDRVWLELMELI